jgi:L1 cell adhesion molecule like protein
LPRGQAQIWITCDVDTNYNITVEAKEKSSGVKNKKSILMQKGRLSKENIEKLKLEFEQEEEKESSEFKAKQKLKNYCLKLNQNIPDIQLKINQILLWIENNPEASEEEINLKRQELNDLFKE